MRSTHIWQETIQAWLTILSVFALHITLFRCDGTGQTFRTLNRSCLGTVSDIWRETPAVRGRLVRSIVVQRRSAFRRRSLSLGQGALYKALVFPHQLRKIIGDGHIQSVNGTASEVCACCRKLLEFVQRIQPEEIPVNLWIWQIVARDIRECRKSFVDVVVLRMFYDFVGDLLAVSKHRLVVIVRC